MHDKDYKILMFVAALYFLLIFIFSVIDTKLNLLNLKLKFLKLSRFNFSYKLENQELYKSITTYNFLRKQYITFQTIIQKNTCNYNNNA